jgi:2-oxoisovalerate dehydrogenase E1 component
MAKKNMNDKSAAVQETSANKNNGKTETGTLAATGLTGEELLNAYRIMLLSRNIDNKAMNLLKQGKTFFHIAAAGHEAIQAALGLVLKPEKDWLFPYYRDLALVLSAGVTSKDFFLQCFAKTDDPGCGGRQLPCHYGANHINLPAQSSPTGTQFLQAVGTALASVNKGIKNISYVSSGEGTTSQGEFHEAVNWASRQKLPVLFVIQNNKYAISVHVNQQSGGKGNSVSEMMTGYDNLLRLKIDGTDFIESYNAVKKAEEYLIAGNGPVLIEAEVVRLFAHSSSDDQKKYRDQKELEEDRKKDPNEKMLSSLLKEKYLTPELAEKMSGDVLEEINKASDEAAKSADPDPAEAHTHVFDESGFKDTLVYENNKPSGANIVMVDAINHALHEELERNEKIYVFGEDIADPKGGVFTATKGLSGKFGESRVFNSPLAEASIMGVATGMALAGLKPVVEIQFGDYIWPAFMQMKDELATIRYRSNNYWNAPVVTRVAVGGYIHGGLYHSQNIESIFAHVPGIYIVYPSNAADAKGLLKTACRINDPVLFCEHKGLYRQSYATTPEPDSEYLIPFGKAKVVREGSDVTVISYGASLWDAVLAAKKFDEEGYSVEVIDLRTIIPLDEETIFNSVKKTGKAVIIHEDTLTGGFGAEVAARISDTCFQFLDGPVKRIAAKDSHIPYAPILESAILPSRSVVYKGIKEILDF